ncbi:MAG: AmmeMemoRadiSam system protein B [Anaerolineae bacterium]|nr:AmmeMemoRadiSam system protein B [Anaerolineae bacterium]
MSQPQQDIRPSPITGMWYPGNAANLRAELDRFLQKANPLTRTGDVLGLLTPHAGLRYSGGVAAYAFKQIADQPIDTVVVIGPLHRPIPGITSAVVSTAHTAYETPLGKVPVDRDILDHLAARLSLSCCRCDPEHSIEIELPFLQVVLPAGFTLIPLMLRDQSAEGSRALGVALIEVLKDRHVLFVASSDLSHFYPQDVAATLDHKMLEAVAQMDAERVIQLDERGEGFACGRGAIAATIHAVRALGATRAEVLHHATSGTVSGDFARVVGYGAASFTRTQ